MNIDVLLAGRRLWSLHIACEEFLSCLGTLLLQALGVVLPLVRLEELVGIGASGDDHRGISAATEDTLIESDVLWEVSLFIDPTIWVLVFLLLGHDTGMGCEALSAWCATRLLHHL